MKRWKNIFSFLSCNGLIDRFTSNSYAAAYATFGSSWQGAVKPPALESLKSFTMGTTPLSQVNVSRCEN